MTAGVIALLGVGAAGGFLLHSPDERITHEPVVVPVTAPIESRTLTAQVTGVGVFEAAGTIPVTVAAPNGMSGVVTAAPRSVGETVPWCGQAVEVSGRPVFVLHGTVPAYRDLTEGDSGADVRQLQTALKECGYRVTVDGVFGPGTAAAITKLYQVSGHTAVTDPAAALAAGEPAGRSSSPASAVVVSRGEVVFVPAPPRITNVLPVGSYVTADPVVELALAGDVFTLHLTAEQKAAVTAGQRVTITRDGWTATVILPDLPVVPEYDDSGAPSFPVHVPLPDLSPAGSNGQQGQFTITTGSDQAYPTVVPVSAIHEDPSGQPYVLLAPAAHATGTGGPTSTLGTRVPVRVLESVQGYVAIESDDDALHPGDEVVIGDR